MDIGQAFEDTYFINIAAAGSFTELTYSVPSQLKTMFGYLAYLAKGVELLPGIRTVPVRIKHEKGVFEGDVSMIFAAILIQLVALNKSLQMLNLMMVNSL